MTALAALQLAMKRYLFDGDRAVARAIDDRAGLSADDRLSIYANAYRARSIEALSTDYPALRCMLGDADFASLCERYVRAFPSTSFTLRDFGASLSRHIAADHALAQRAFMTELAAVEWAFVDAFDASDAPTADARAMARWAPQDWPDLEIDVHPSVRRLDLEWNSLEVWKAVTTGGERPPIESSEPRVCFVWRRGYETVFRSVDAVERSAWLALAGGGTFASACDALVGDVEPDAVPLRAATLLHTWLADGLIAAVRVRRSAADELTTASG
jgi:hypothetical protein